MGIKSQYKSPISALLWSITMSGFGQLYIEQYFLGTVLLVLECSTNMFSLLNLSILHTFHGCLWFLIWQAYNKAIILNYQQEGKKPPEQTYLHWILYRIGNWHEFWSLLASPLSR